MGHDERHETCDVPVHPAATHPGVVVKETVPTVSVVDGCIAAIGMDILNPAPDSFTAQVKT